MRILFLLLFLAAPALAQELPKPEPPVVVEAPPEALTPEQLKAKAKADAEYHLTIKHIEEALKQHANAQMPLKR